MSGCYSICSPIYAENICCSLHFVIPDGFGNIHSWNKNDSDTLYKHTHTYVYIDIDIDIYTYIHISSPCNTVEGSYALAEILNDTI